MATFTLCYKDYDFGEITFQDTKDFHRETGKCLLNFLCHCYYRFHVLMKSGGSIGDVITGLTTEFSDLECSQALYILAKKHHKNVTVDEIWDGATKTQYFSCDLNGKNEPIQIVVASIGADFVKAKQEMTEEKKDLALLQ